VDERSLARMKSTRSVTSESVFGGGGGISALGHAAAAGSLSQVSRRPPPPAAAAAAASFSLSSLGTDGQGKRHWFRSTHTSVSLMMMLPPPHLPLADWAALLASTAHMDALALGVPARKP
jgi:hypothetical protein